MPLLLFECKLQSPLIAALKESKHSVTSISSKIAILLVDHNFYDTFTNCVNLHTTLLQQFYIQTAYSHRVKNLKI